jgi:hypothetical protein
VLRLHETYRFLYIDTIYDEECTYHILRISIFLLCIASLTAITMSRSTFLYTQFVCSDIRTKITIVASKRTTTYGRPNRVSNCHTRAEVRGGLHKYGQYMYHLLLLLLLLVSRQIWFLIDWLLKSVGFWVITRRRVVIIYRRFETTYRSHPHGSRFQVGILTREDGTDTLSRNVGK